jgi:zinc protease
VARIDVTRSQVELQTQQNRLTAQLNDFAKQKIALETNRIDLGKLLLPPRTWQEELKIPERQQRTMKRPQGPRDFEKTMDTPTDQAFVFSGFYGCDESNLTDTRAMNMASRIISTRMTTEVREEAQLVYSIGASLRPGTTYPGFGVFSASATTDPVKTIALKDKLAAMYQAFAKDGPSDDELTVAKKQRANDFDEQMKQPGFWQGQLDQLTYRGMSLDEVMSAPAAYQAITTKQIKDTFVKYYGKENTIVVTVMPQAGQTKDAGKDKKSETGQ